MPSVASGQAVGRLSGVLQRPPAGSAGRTRTLVIIPAFNEEASLPRVLEELATAGTDLDVLVVDDGSTDRTAEVARDAGAMVAPLPFNLGVGGALRTGFKFAVAREYDRALQLDADGQHDPGDIERLLAGLDEGADMVIGSRFVSTEPTDAAGSGGSAYRVGRVRGGGMRLLRFAVRALAGKAITDTSSGFRAFSQPMLAFFSTNYPIDYLGDTVEALILAVYGGFEVAEIPVVMRERSAGQPSSRNLRLVYHYVRLVIALTMTAPVKLRRRMA